MDPKLLFWSGALLNLGVIVVLVAIGVRSVRRGEIARHRRCMLTSAWLIIGFLGAYALKLAFLGREQLSLWSPMSLHNLRVHELCVLTMIVGGSIALWRSRELRHTRNATRDPGDRAARPTVVVWHRRAGWSAAVGAGLGFATAIGILVGMFERAG